MPGATRPCFSKRTRNWGVCGATRWSRWAAGATLSTSRRRLAVRPTSKPLKCTVAGRASKKRFRPSWEQRLWSSGFVASPTSGAA